MNEVPYQDVFKKLIFTMSLALTQHNLLFWGDFPCAIVKSKAKAGE